MGLAGMLLLPEMAFSAAPSPKRKITILHTNDMHSHIDPFPADDPQYAGLGGMSRRAALIDKIRSEEELVLLLDSGDIFQGTPYFNFFGGEPEFKLMSAMNYDAATMGNHDFDNGLEGFLKMLPHATFPFVCSNYDFSETILKGKTLSHTIITRGGIKIGIFGLGVELDGLVAKKNYGKTKYLDPIAVAQQKSAELRNQHHCDMVICLSHLGYSYKTEKISDLKLAALSKGIDLILGGHTHTFLEKVTLVKNADGNQVIVNQAGWGGIRLGRIDIEFEKSPKNLGLVGDFAYISSTNKDVC